MPGGEDSAVRIDPQPGDGLEAAAGSTPKVASVHDLIRGCRISIQLYDESSAAQDTAGARRHERIRRNWKIGGLGVPAYVDVAVRIGRRRVCNTAPVARAVEVGRIEK